MFSQNYNKMSTEPNNSASQKLISETKLTKQMISLYRKQLNYGK